MIHAAVLHGIGQTPRYEPFPAPVAGDGEAVLTATAAALKPSDRWMANGVHYAPTEFPRVMGLDRLGRLSDGTRVAFFTPLPPYGGAVFAALTRPELRLARAPSGSVTSRVGIVAGAISVDIDPVPLAQVEQAWPDGGATGASSSFPDSGRQSH